MCWGTPIDLAQCRCHDKKRKPPENQPLSRLGTGGTPLQRSGGFGHAEIGDPGPRVELSSHQRSYRL